jgi:predicted P-loop ATPase
LQMPSDHPLQEPLTFAVGAIMAQSRVDGAAFDVLAVLAAAHEPTFEIMRERLGLKESGSLGAACARFNARCEFELKTKGGWITNGKTDYPESARPANFHRLLRILDCQVRRNEWLDRDEIRGGHEWPRWTHINDAVVARLLTEARNHGFQPSKDFVWDTIATFADDNKVDPAIDRLRILENSWDGKSRVDEWLSRVFGVRADTYHRLVGRRIVGGMVRRIREPGCKIDEMAVLIGEQGISKSKACRMLSPVEDGFTDGVKLGEESKELILLLPGFSVVEVAEMSKRTVTGVETIKAMLSKTHDFGRTVYSRAPTNRKRRNIFIGTSNGASPLIDVTGNRRFLPVRCERVDMEFLASNVEQLIGEACALQTQGETFDIPEDTWDIAHEHQEAARERADFELLLEDWFAEMESDQPARAEFITATDLASLLRNNLRGTVAPNAVSAVMGRLGFESDRRKIGSKATRLWRRGDWLVNGEGMNRHQQRPTPNLGSHHVVYLPARNLPPLPY